MILYEFICKACGKEFEELSSGDTTGIKCPYCGSEKVSKLISAPRCKVSSSASVGSAPSACSSVGGFS